MNITHECGLCGCSKNQLLFHKWGFPIIKCSSCDFVETIVHNGMDFSSLYSEDYYNGGKIDGYVDYKASQFILEKEFNDLLSSIEKFKPEHNLLVELGSAYGFLLKQASKEYKRSIGFEISVSSINYCLQMGLEVYPVSQLGDTMLNLPPVDVLVMLDTIEHVEKPKELLNSLFNYIKKGGLIVITTGDVGSFYSKITGKHWRLMTPPQHLSFFSAKTMCRMLELAGFKILAVEKPWKRVPLKLVVYQIFSRIGLKNIGFIQKIPNIGVPINLFDAMRIIAKRP